MCLPGFIRFDQIREDDPMIGYRSWKNSIGSLYLESISRDYTWKVGTEGPHLIKHEDSGLYTYNNYNNHNYNNNYYNYDYYNYYNHNHNYNNYNYYNYYNHNHNYNNYNYYNNYYNLSGTTHQWGKIAIHEIGQRSEYAKIVKLFTIRESDAKGREVFLSWISKFNSHIKRIAEMYGASTIDWQDLVEER